MDLLQELQKIAGKDDFEESSNYYFQRHSCEKSGKEEKVMLDFTLSNDKTDKILRFGLCEHCGKVFYHRDFSAKSF